MRVAKEWWARRKNGEQPKAYQVLPTGERYFASLHKPGLDSMDVSSAELATNAETYRALPMPQPVCEPSRALSDPALLTDPWLPENATAIAKCVLRCKVSAPGSREQLTDASRRAFGASAPSEKVRLAVRTESGW